jgi:hypothetical protein
MPILDEQRFPFGGPYADFADLQQPLAVEEHDWPSREIYQEHVFFRMSDSLCDTLCSATRTYLPFDCYGFTQMSRPYKILELSAEWLLRAHTLAVTPTHYFRDSLGSRTLPSTADMSAEAALASFQRDLLDTLLFLSQRLHYIAFSNRCLTIVGY